METSTNSDLHKSVPQKSPNYPNMSLDEALVKARTLYDKDGKAGAPRKVALDHLGYKVESGASARTISALRKFDLITDVAGRIVPTQKAVDLIIYPQDSERYNEALRHCALNPRIYSMLWEKYNGNLPSDASLKAELIDEYNFNRNQVDGFLKDFRATLDFSALKPREGNEEMREQPQLEQSGQFTNRRPAQPATTTKVYGIPLKNGNEAMLTFKTLPLDKLDIEVIEGWIKLMKGNLIEDQAQSRATT